MPLLDHFHPPLSVERHWQSFHAVWATEIMAALNRDVLPDDYFAEAQVHVGSRVEIDVASFQEAGTTPHGHESHGGVAVEVWAPPATALVMPTVFPDEIEVQVYDAGATLVAALELISPGNKDRPETRSAFAARCSSYLQMGVGLVIVDVVTERSTNLHDELIGLLGQSESFRFPSPAPLYVISYRPSRQPEPGGDQVEIWPFPLSLGSLLPVVPLALRRGPTLPLDLEAAYSEARLRSRL